MAHRAEYLPRQMFRAHGNAQTRVSRALQRCSDCTAIIRASSAGHDHARVRRSRGAYELRTRRSRWLPQDGSLRGRDTQGCPNPPSCPTKLELLLNLRTAKALGISVPLT